MRLLTFFLLALLCLFVSSGVAASASSSSSVAERVANQKSLRVSVEAGEGKFARLDAESRQRLLREQDELFAVLDGKRSASDLSAQERARVEAAESEIEKIVASLEPATAQRTVRCSYQARIGSNRKERVCRDIKSSGDEEGRDALRRLGRCKGSQGCSGSSTPAG